MIRFARLGLVLLPALAACFSASAEDSADESPDDNPDARTGILATSAGDMKITYELRNGKAVFEGDIVLADIPREGPSQQATGEPSEEPSGEASEEPGEEASDERIKPKSVGAGNATRRFSLGSLWPHGVVYYRYDATVGTSLKTTIQQALNHYRQRTPLYFIEDTGKVQSTYINFISPAGSKACNSGIGYPGAGKTVTTELGAGCNSFDVVIHEMGHAIGLRHEHTRADRDSYITIDTANLKPGKSGNFTKWEVREGILTDYDFDSVMHYNSMVSDTDFVYDTTKPVFTRKDGSVINAQDGQGLSDADVRGIQEMYGSELEPVAPTVAWSPNRLDTFVRGTDGALFHKSWNGSSWTPSAIGYDYLGGYLIGSPEVVSLEPYRLDVFVRGSDRALYRKVLTGAGWWPSQIGYEYLGGNLASHPSAVATGPNRLDVFAKGNDGQVLHKAWTGVSWYPSATGWESLGGYSNGSVKAVSWGSNRIDLFTIGTNFALFHKSWNGSSWWPSATGWESLGGILQGQPSVVSWGPNRLDIVAKGLDGSVFHKALSGSSWYPSATGWASLGGSIIGNPEVVSWGPNRLDVVAQGLDGQLFHKAFAGSSWYPSVIGWEGLGGTIIGTPSMVSWGPNRLDIFARGMNDALLHKAWNGSSWYPSVKGFESLGGAIAW